MPSEGEPARRGRPRDTAVDQRVLDAAWALLLTGGYAGLNHEAGITLFGKTFGLFDIQNAAQEQGMWVGYGKWKVMPAPKPAKAIAPAVRCILSGTTTARERSRVLKFCE